MHARGAEEDERASSALPTEENQFRGVPNDAPRQHTDAKAMRLFKNETTR
jgi:hypothetical protein